ncbi:hypothetical protein ACFXHD_41070, partial [Streptomyces hydrogenans]|uniref:hypothetical protein n=1 Tax=Streptomyces hydrogenans TaxID=1873719 RepID=UPI0036C04E8C
TVSATVGRTAIGTTVSRATVGTAVSRTTVSATIGRTTIGTTVSRTAIGTAVGRTTVSATIGRATIGTTVSRAAVLAAAERVDLARRVVGPVLDGDVHQGVVVATDGLGGTGRGQGRTGDDHGTGRDSRQADSRLVGHLVATPSSFISSWGSARGPGHGKRHGYWTCPRSHAPQICACHPATLPSFR